MRNSRYDDFLEIPLQPLYDNLDSYTYEVFEKDPVKYIFYQRAIEQALLDKISNVEANTKTVRTGKVQYLMELIDLNVFGTGRGNGGWGWTRTTRSICV